MECELREECALLTYRIDMDTLCTYWEEWASSTNTGYAHTSSHFVHIITCAQIDQVMIGSSITWVCDLVISIFEESRVMIGSSFAPLRGEGSLDWNATSALTLSTVNLCISTKIKTCPAVTSVYLFHMRYCVLSFHYDNTEHRPTHPPTPLLLLL